MAGDTEFTPQYVLNRCWDASNSRLRVAGSTSTPEPVTRFSIQAIFNRMVELASEGQPHSRLRLDGD